MKVVDWVPWTSQYPEADVCSLRVLETVSSYVREHGLMFDGNYHQRGVHGCPLLDSGRIVRCSLRTWGLIMAMATGEAEIDNYAYCKYAWGLPEGIEEVLPR